MNSVALTEPSEYGLSSGFSNTSLALLFSIQCEAKLAAFGVEHAIWYMCIYGRPGERAPKSHRRKHLTDLIRLQYLRHLCNPCSNTLRRILCISPSHHQETQWASHRNHKVRLLLKCQSSFLLRSIWVWRAGENLQSPTRQVAQRRCKKGGNTHLRYLSNGKLKCTWSLCNRGVTEFRLTEILNFIENCLQFVNRTGTIKVFS